MGVIIVVLIIKNTLKPGFVSGRSIFSLILWFCKLTNPFLPTLLCSHPGHPLVIIYNLCFMPGPSSFHSSNLCLYLTIHSCVRTFPSSSGHLVLPPCVFIRTIISVFTFSNMFVYPQHHLFVLSLLPCLFSDHHLRDISVLFEYRPISLFPLYNVFVSEPSSPNPICTMSLPGPSNFDLCFLYFNPDHTQCRIYHCA